MTDTENSVGIVTPQRFVFDEPIALEAGSELLALRVGSGNLW